LHKSNDQEIYVRSLFELLDKVQWNEIDYRVLARLDVVLAE
jgi:hypothetical protein